MDFTLRMYNLSIQRMIAAVLIAITVATYATSMPANGLISPDQLSQKDFEEQQFHALQVELKRMSKEIKLSEEHFEKVKTAVDDAVKSGAATMFKYNGSSTTLHKTSAVLSRELAEAIQISVAKHVEPDALADYVADFQKFNQWEDKVSRQMVMVFLDTYLDLTANQFATIEERLKQRWNDGWNCQVRRMSFDGYKACAEALASLENVADETEQMSKILTATQFLIFAQLETIGEGYPRILRIDSKGEQEIFERESNLFLRHAIESLGSLTSLTPDQLSYIRVGMKGTFRRVKQFRNEQKIAYEKNGRSLWLMSAFMDSSFYQFRNNAMWKRVVEKVLPESAHAEYLEIKSVRDRRRTECGAVFGIGYLGSARRFTSKEVIGLHDLVTAKIAEEGEKTIYRGTYVMFSLTDEELKSVIGPDSWESIAVRLKKCRDNWGKNKRR